jgi:hypothetical protein
MNAFFQQGIGKIPYRHETDGKRLGIASLNRVILEALSGIISTRPR